MKTACLNSWSTKDSGNSKESYLASVMFHELFLGKCWNLMAKFHLLKISTSIYIYSVLKSVKLLLALSILIISSNYLMF